MKRLLVLPVVALVCVAEMYRRGSAAPILFGCKQWVAARPARYFEPDYMA